MVIDADPRQAGVLLLDGLEALEVFAFASASEFEFVGHQIAG